MNLPKPEIDRDSAMELWITERSDYAKEQVVLNNKGIILIVLKSLNLNPLDEDLFSTGMVGIVKVVNTFCADKGFKFSTYATRIVQNEIFNMLKKKRIVPSFSLDEPCRMENREECSYADVIEDSKSFEEEVIAHMQLGEANTILSGREKEVLLLRMEGKKQKEIAEICGVSQSGVSRIIKKAFEKYKKMDNGG